MRFLLISLRATVAVATTNGDAIARMMSVLSRRIPKKNRTTTKTPAKISPINSGMKTNALSVIGNDLTLHSEQLCKDG